MIYKNKLGTFTFDDDVQESRMKLIVQNITGQYFNPKKGEPELTDEESCYEFIRERCGNVLGGIGFELEINDDVRVLPEMTHDQQVKQLIKAFDARVAENTKKAEAALERLLDEEVDLERLLDEEVEHIRASFGGWLVGPAALQ